MKYYNKRKKYRNTWTTVDGPSAYKAAEVKRRCQLNGSKDRFYFRLNTPLPFDHGERRSEWPRYFENRRMRLRLS